MKQKLILFVCLLIFSSALSAQKNDDDKTEEELKKEIEDLKQDIVYKSKMLHNYQTQWYNKCKDYLKGNNHDLATLEYLREHTKKDIDYNGVGLYGAIEWAISCLNNGEDFEWPIDFAPEFAPPANAPEVDFAGEKNSTKNKEKNEKPTKAKPTKDERKNKEHEDDSPVPPKDDLDEKEPDQKDPIDNDLPKEDDPSKDTDEKDGKFVNDPRLSITPINPKKDPKGNRTEIGGMIDKGTKNADGTR